MEIKDIILKTLRDNGAPMKSKEIAEVSGIDKSEIDKAIKVLKKEEKIVSPKVCYYEPK